MGPLISLQSVCTRGPLGKDGPGSRCELSPLSLSPPSPFARGVVYQPCMYTRPAWLVGFGSISTRNPGPGEPGRNPW